MFFTPDIVSSNFIAFYDYIHNYALLEFSTQEKLLLRNIIVFRQRASNTHNQNIM